MKFGVINVENSLAWQPLTFADMFQSLLKDDTRDEHWQIFNVASDAAACSSSGQEYIFPDLTDYDGLVITGSHFNCRDGDSLAWFDPLCSLIRYAAEKGTPRVYGGCFGCQIIGHALGGEVDYNPDKKFVLKAEQIIPRQLEFKEFFGLDEENSDTARYLSQLKIIESHGDCVKTLPPGATLLASSSSCAHEIYVAGVHKNLLACQSHPEFDLDYAIHERIWKSVVVMNKRLSDEAAQSALDSFEGFTRESGPDFFIQCIKKFLRKL